MFLLGEKKISLDYMKLKEKKMTPMNLKLDNVFGCCLFIYFYHFNNT